MSQEPYTQLQAQVLANQYHSRQSRPPLVHRFVEGVGRVETSRTQPSRKESLRYHVDVRKRHDFVFEEVFSDLVPGF